MMSKDGEIRRDDACLDFNQGSVTLYTCHAGKGNQEWRWNETGELYHPVSRKCLAVSPEKDKLVMEPCVKSEIRQQWKFENFNRSLLSHSE